MEKLRVVFHNRFFNSEYSGDPAASPGRLESIMEYLGENSNRYEVVTPEQAADEDILRAHSQAHLLRIQRDPLLFELASLAAGGSVMAARLAFAGSPAFAAIRPPGHHASADSCWGFCFFNNISVSLLHLYAAKKIQSAFVLDFDLHTGDGNINILENRHDGFRVDILNPVSYDSREYLAEIDKHMEGLKDIDIFVASAGFDQGISDWGNLLSSGDYQEIGRMMREHSERLCARTGGTRSSKGDTTTRYWERMSMRFAAGSYRELFQFFKFNQ